MGGYNLNLDLDRGGAPVGHCDGCTYWQCDDHGAGAASVGRCHEPENAAIDLRVSAQSGCSHFEPAPATAGAMTAGGA